jgi:hypothetical protein
MLIGTKSLGGVWEVLGQSANLELVLCLSQHNPTFFNKLLVLESTADSRSQPGYGDIHFTDGGVSGKAAEEAEKMAEVGAAEGSSRDATKTALAMGAAGFREPASGNSTSSDDTTNSGSSKAESGEQPGEVASWQRIFDAAKAVMKPDLDGPDLLVPVWSSAERDRWFHHILDKVVPVLVQGAMDMQKPTIEARLQLYEHTSSKAFYEALEGCLGVLQVKCDEVIIKQVGSTI